MSNSAIQIKRGPGQPGQNVLKPYELGYDTQNNELYIGTENGTPRLINSVTSITKGGTGATTAQEARENLGINYTNLGTVPIISGGTGATSAETARSNLGINYANLGIVPITQGGTGANSAAQALVNLGAFKLKLEWENADTTVSFNAQTFTDVDFSEYNLALCLFYDGYMYHNISPIIIVPIGEKGEAITLTGTSTWQMLREFQINADSIEFKECSRNNGTSTVISNDRLIPYRIYGIKL